MESSSATPDRQSADNSVLKMRLKEKKIKKNEGSRH
jgi:hypothetical protein